MKIPPGPGGDSEFSGKQGETGMYNILICDDQPDIVNALKIYLTPEGYHLFEAFNGKEALEIYEQKPDRFFDCIFLDINMPQMDGYETVRAIRKSAKADAHTVPVFAMTANAFSEDVTEAMNAGMNGHIAKPIEIHILYETLQEVFKGYEQV